LLDELGLDVDVLLARLHDHGVGDERAGDIALGHAGDAHVGALLGLECGDLIEQLGRLGPALDQVELLLDRDGRIRGAVEEVGELLRRGHRGLLLGRGGRGGRLAALVVVATGGQAAECEGGEGDCGDGPSKTHAWGLSSCCSGRDTGPTYADGPLIHTSRPGRLTTSPDDAIVEHVNTAETSTDTPHVVICTTGGTIVASTSADGVVTAGDSDPATETMLAELRSVLPGSVRVSARSVLDADSATFGPPQWDEITDAVAEVLADPGVSGVVVAHGTDTLEETAMALDLHHRDPRPVAVTGAQLPADHPEADGPANLLDAVLLAADPVSRDLGVLVVLGRAILQARGVRNWHTTEPVALARSAPDLPVEGLPPELERPVLPARARFDSVRVDVVACPPGADAAALHACIDAGARGLVLEGSGSGNL